MTSWNENQRFVILSTSSKPLLIALTAKTLIDRDRSELINLDRSTPYIFIPPASSLSQKTLRIGREFLNKIEGFLNRK